MRIVNTILKFLRQNFIEQSYTSPSTNTLDGINCIVTGTGRGVGFSIAKVLITHGAKVVGLTRTPNIVLSKTANYEEIVCDVTSEKEVIESIKAIKSKYGHIDTLINNVGIFSHNKLENSTSRDFEKIVSTNMMSVYLMTREVLRLMKKQKSGTIINIGSKISHNSKIEPGKVLYAMSKFAVEGFTLALNRELQGTGIRAICLMPSTIHTFVSRKASEYLSPYDIGELIKMIISMKQVDFESILIKSKQQDI